MSMIKTLKVEFHFRSGKALTFKCDEVETTSDTNSGKLIGYKINGLKRWSKPQFISMSDVEAVVIKQGLWL